MNVSVSAGLVINRLRPIMTEKRRKTLLARLDKFDSYMYT